MKYYKNLNADMTCRDHKFEIGKEYWFEGAPILCKNGFHFHNKWDDLMLKCSKNVSGNLLNN